MEALRLPPIVTRIDRWFEAGVLGRQGGRFDAPAHLISSVADRSKLWTGLAVLRAATDHRQGRSAAVRMITAVGLQSLVVEGVVKRLFARQRPVDSVVPLRFGARRPPSSSFPSGHSASAACAAVLLSEGTAWGPPLALLAGAVAWSRMQTGLHHATDVAVGLAIGTGVGLAVRNHWPLARR